MEGGLFIIFLKVKNKNQLNALKDWFALNQYGKDQVMLSWLWKVWSVDNILGKWKHLWICFNTLIPNINNICI